MIVDPRGMDVITWTSMVTPLIDPFGTVGTLMKAEDWQDWGANVMKVLKLDPADLPNPFEYQDWRAWADRFCQVTDNIL
jgi:hypothetical protein